jgi:hypothetical protein
MVVHHLIDELGFARHAVVVPLVNLPSALKSCCPTSDQPGIGKLLSDRTELPFMSHTAVLPLASCQTMSLLPSPLKS